MLTYPILLLTLLPVQTSANSAPVLDVQNRVVGVGQELKFVVFPRDPDGVVPDLYMTDAPLDAALDDNGDGTRTFSWQPESKGTFNINFTVEDAQDATLTSDHEATIAVVEPGTVTQALNEALQATVDTAPLVDSDGFNSQISIGDNIGDVKKILIDSPVSISQTNVQQSSVAIADGRLYTVNIETGPSGDKDGFDLRTVLWQGRQRPSGAWQWRNVVISERTVHDRWHTAPSVGVDKAGYIHVAYNMHNFPWQYKRSVNPHDIASFEFRGQALSDDEIKRSVEQNKTSFPTLGMADIPGNQITYPSFYKDRNNDLYISYRFAAAPKRGFSDRFMSSGIAVYNTTASSWTAIGGKVTHTNGDFEAHVDAPSQAIAFAGKRGWTSYLPKLGFDSQNNLFMSMVWREGIAGELLTRPCVVRTSDRVTATDITGKAVSLPVSPDVCGSVGIGSEEPFYSIGSFAVSNDGVPYMLVSPEDGSRYISRYSESDNGWVQEKSPENATEIFFDADGNLYAVAAGIKISKRTNDDAQWQLIYDEGKKNNCYPKVRLDQASRIAAIHTQSCDEKTVTVYGLRLTDQ